MLEAKAPVEYSVWWWIVLGILVALFVAWLLLVPALTKRKLSKKHTELALPPVPQISVEQTYLERIDALQADFTFNKINQRQLHLALSELVREFVEHRTGITATTMTYSDLLDNPRTHSMAAVIAQCYHPAFSRSGTAPHWNPTESATPITLTNARIVVETL